MTKRRRDLTVMQQLARGPVDIPFLMLVVILTAIGVVAVFSSSYPTAMNEGLDPANYFIKQATFGGVGLVAMYLISKINYQTFRGLSVFVLGISIVLLVLVIPFGYGRATVGAQRWIRLPIIGGFQPSEIAKVGVIMFFAARLSKRNTEKRRRLPPRHPLSGLQAWLDEKGVLEPIPYFLILGLVAVLMLMEPHMSGTILVLAGGASVLFAAGIHWGWFVAGITGVGSLLWIVITMTPYMTNRINLWLDPWSQRQGLGYQTVQSLIAIGSGGMLGRGLGESVQKMLYIPEPENDFVFPIVVEELGFVGGLVVLVLFALLILRGYWLALNARDKFGALTIVGIITLLAVQVFLNIGVVTNLIPNTGISLPFFSYGGTALMIQLGEMGMVLSISRQIPPPKHD